MLSRNCLPFLVLPIISGLAQISAGKCALKCPIPFDVDPKCGSDGVTYQNIEELDCAKTLCYPDLTLAYNGSCETAITLLLGTNKKPKVIQSKPTPIGLQIAQTVKNDPSPLPTVTNTPTKAKLTRRPLSVVLGQNSLNPPNCDSLEDCTCDYEMNPVCGSNNVTYGNLCVLQCAQKCDAGLSLHHTGFCGRIFFSRPLPLKFFTALPPTALNELEHHNDAPLN